MHEDVRMSVAARRTAMRFAEGVSTGVRNLFIVLYVKSFCPVGAGLTGANQLLCHSWTKEKGLTVRISQALVNMVNSVRVFS